MTDTTLVFFLTEALLCYLHKKYWLMYVCMALATVTKGPIGIVFPGAIIFLHILCTGQWRLILKMHCVRGLLLYFLIAAPWYYLMYQVHGMEFINTFLGFHNLTRFTTPEHPTRVLWWYYFPIIVLGLFPWTGLLLQSVKASIADSRSDDLGKMLFVNIWWLFVLIFFTVSKTKLVSYILPMFLALAIMIGWNIARMQKENYGIRWSWILGSGIMFLLLTVGWVIGGQQLPEVTFGGIVLGIVTFILGLSIIWALWYYRDISFAAWLHVVTGVLTMVIAFSFLLPMVANRFSVKEITKVYQSRCDQQKPVYVDKFLRPGFMYYTGEPGLEVKPKSNDLAAALNAPNTKYILVRGLELRRLKDQNKLQHLNEITELGDIYLLENIKNQ
ncbi:MAG: glycosyltransferase family 39 protein [Acidaminococcaceae bacterium]|nr:glycosyltransferase family 39 protein [Acidaminococcaceae bacterium]